MRMNTHTHTYLGTFVFDFSVRVFIPVCVWLVCARMCSVRMCVYAWYVVSVCAFMCAVCVFVKCVLAFFFIKKGARAASSLARLLTYCFHWEEQS